MEKTPKIREELKALGTELAEAFKQIRSSAELKELERDVAAGLRKIGTSIARSLKAAAKAEQTSKIGKRLGTVARAGAIEGRKGAVKAGHAAAVRLRRVSEAVRKASRRRQLAKAE